MADSEAPATISAMIGLVVETVSGSQVQAYIDVDERHHQGSGTVHGGIYAHVIESVATIGSSAAVREQGQRTVGVNNQTDFLRPFAKGRLSITAWPVQQGRTLQLWSRSPILRASSSPAARCGSSTSHDGSKRVIDGHISYVSRTLILVLKPNNSRLSPVADSSRLCLSPARCTHTMH